MSLPTSMLRALWGAAPAQGQDPFATVGQKLRAWPWLCDRLGHINNARYIDLLGYGRLYWMVQNGLFRPMLRGRVSLLVAGVGGVYRHSIPRMAEFTLHTRLAAFDERWIYHEQTFVLGASNEAKVAARFLTRSQLRSRTAALAPREALRRWGRELVETSPVSPSDLEAWLKAQEACLDVMRSP